MTRLCVVSDSHADLSRLPVLLAALGDSVDWLLHAGDHIADAVPIAQALGLAPDRVRAVVGNCDYPIEEPTQERITIDGVRIWMTHGHHFRVKERLDGIGYRAAEVGARVAVFGHSHVPMQKEQDGLLLFNPGSMSAPRRATDPPSCGLLEITSGTVTARHLWLAQAPHHCGLPL